ncbi:tryptophan--tRNA ligase [Patescibacteria group bacterium]|nr:tryptophan--tRNA ligase [Patescibacteria group bacterium]
MSKKVVFSGIQPSGNLHIGNYIGAISQWVKMQDEYDCIYCIVDLHAITVPQDPKILKEKVLEVAALYLATGIDPQKSHIFIQSENPDHTYLTWILNCLTPFGQLERMTQFKTKSGIGDLEQIEKEFKQFTAKDSSDHQAFLKTQSEIEGEILKSFNKEKIQKFINLSRKIIDHLQRNIEHRDQTVAQISSWRKRGSDSFSAGLFDYPVLMASDILLYHTDEVPVGEDQKQHIELTRDVADKFNKTFGEIFKLPNPHISKFADARIMSLQNPNNKMSKSDKDPLGTINLLDSEDQIREKIKKAVTDSEPVISAKAHGEGNGALQNLLTIYAAVSGVSYNTALQKTQGKSYGEFKKELADLVVDALKPIREKYLELRNDEKSLRMVLDEGRNFAMSKSSKVIAEVKEKIGLV